MRDLCVTVTVSARCSLFFFNDTATTEIYTLSLHDALPIFLPYKNKPASPGEIARNLAVRYQVEGSVRHIDDRLRVAAQLVDRKSTRLNSSHANISYAVFCLKKNNSASPPSLLCRNTRAVAT